MLNFTRHTTGCLFALCLLRSSKPVAQPVEVVYPDHTPDQAGGAVNVFVYGTLQPGERFHDDICSPFTFSASKAWVQGRLFDFPELGYPAAVEDPHSKIYGYLLRFEQPARSLLHALDQLEGYNPHGPPEDNLYYRLTVTVWPTNHSRPIRAWCYFMTLERVKAQGGVALPNGHWP